MSDGPLFTWMYDIANRIADHATYGILPIVPELPKVRDAGHGFLQQLQKITAAMTGVNGRAGLGVYLTMPHTESAPDTEGGLRTFIVTEISVVESRINNCTPVTGFAPNGIGWHSDDVAWALALNLLNWRDQPIADAARPQTVLTGHAGWIPPDLREKTEAFDLIVTAFQLRALMSVPKQSKCFPPVISIGAGHATIACATSGATIYYTLDGTYPNNASSTYSAPVDVSSGEVVRAVAKKTSVDDSDLAYVAVT